MAANAQKMRLAAGGRIDRSRPLSFSFNGKTYQGFEGDTLASALLANGVRVVGRSMKLHRPRGLLSAGVEEPNALVNVGESGRAEPNVRATAQPLYPGLIAKSQNCWPSVKYDLNAILGWTSSLWVAGFYNKTFMWPGWRWYEDAVRAVAGLGRLPKADDPDTYEHRNAHCEILIVGGGAAGLAAALAAGNAGARVTLIEQDWELGGSLLRVRTQATDALEDNWLKNVGERLAAMPNVTVLAHTTAVGLFDHGVVAAVELLSSRHEVVAGPRQRVWKIRTKKIVIATGAIEQPLVFPNNDRPGVMLASAVREYTNRYGVMPGANIVIATNNDSAYEVAFDLDAAGISVAAIVDERSIGNCGDIVDIAAHKFRVRHNAFVLDAKGTKGVNAVQVGDTHGKPLTSIGGAGTLKCDCLAMSGGWQPAIHLLGHARGEVRYDEAVAGFVPGEAPPHIFIAGAANGVFDLSSAQRDGECAGANAAAELGFDVGRPEVNTRRSRNGYNIKRTIKSRNPGKQWIDFQHDVTLRDIDVAVREDYVSVEHVKRYTTTGMSADQGKTSNVNAIHALAERTNRAIGSVGVTTFRPFYMPVTLGALAGRRKGALYTPTRYSPMDALQGKAGAAFWDYGQWRRPAAYPKEGEALADAMQREAAAVRASVGIYDGSPLGKIEVRGADAAAFLDRFYINNVPSLKIGKARYSIMLDEKGIVIDNGIFARLGEDHYLIHTTSGNASRILAWIEEWRQCEWLELDIIVRSVTPAWANATLSGPNARNVLDALGTDINLANDAFPHMSIAEGVIGNEEVPVRIMRASFTGELSYEVNVPARFGAALWQNLLKTGEPFGITPYGVESLMILRSEKGYIHVGADTDGATIPDDIGWGGPAAKKKADFIGKRSLSLPDRVRKDRRQFVGFKPVAPNQKIISGAHIIGAGRSTGPSEGFVTSAFYSPHLERWLGLGLVQSGRARMGETVNLYHAGSVQPAKIVEPLKQFDPEGERLHV